MKDLKKLEIPGAVTFAEGNGGLDKISIQSRSSSAEIYLLGAQITAFQKKGEAPLLFVSRLSHFTAGKAIRGGVPICFPWFGPREGDVMHGFARIVEWDVVSSALTPEGLVKIRLRLPESPAKSKWPAFTTEFEVTVGEKLTMELITRNTATDQTLEFEDCLHTYFGVGDIHQVSISGLEHACYIDKADNFLRKQETAEPIHITRETNRTYLDTSAPVEIVDGRNQRIITIDKQGSNSTVVWNPWTTQLMPDFAVEEHANMVCVESGNVGQNKVSLGPGAAASLKVRLSSRRLNR